LTRFPNDPWDGEKGSHVSAQYVDENRAPAKNGPDAPGRQAVDARGNLLFDEVKVLRTTRTCCTGSRENWITSFSTMQPGLGVPAGAVTRQQAALNSFGHELNSTLEDQVPGYAKANRQSAALAKRGEAVEAGTQYLGSGKTTPSPDRFAAEFDPLVAGRKDRVCQGQPRQYR
jgi:hypothetical protein